MQNTNMAEVKVKQHPSLNLPKSDTCLQASIINTTTDIVCPASGFIRPVLKGQEYLNLPTIIWSHWHWDHPSCGSEFRASHKTRAETFCSLAGTQQTFRGHLSGVRETMKGILVTHLCFQTRRADCGAGLQISRPAYAWLPDERTERHSKVFLS